MDIRNGSGTSQAQPGAVKAEAKPDTVDESEYEDMAKQLNELQVKVSDTNTISDCKTVHKGSENSMARTKISEHIGLGD